MSRPDKWCRWDLDAKKIKVWFANWSVSRFMPFTAVFWWHWTVVNRPVNRQQGSWLRSSRQRYSNRRTAPSNRTVSSPNQMATQAQTYASSWEIEAISYRLAGMSDPRLVTISKWSDKHPISATSMALVTRDGRPTGILCLDWRHSIFALVIFALDSICSLVYIVRFDNGSG